jgi:hypothetical protein
MFQGRKNPPNPPFVKGGEGGFEAPWEIPFRSPFIKAG